MHGMKACEFCESRCFLWSQTISFFNLEFLILDHIDRVNESLEYIEANLDKNIHLELLAGKFALSKYHFQIKKHEYSLTHNATLCYLRILFLTWNILSICLLCSNRFWFPLGFNLKKRLRFNGEAPQNVPTLLLTGYG